MSNSDDKLDQLYARLDDNSTSPPDLDEQLRAAARDSIAQAQGAAASTSSGLLTGSRWGWATAATVLLTSALFLSLPESQLDIPSAQSRSQAPAASAETAERSTRTATTPEMITAAEIEADMAADVESEPPALSPALSPMLTPARDRGLAANDAAPQTGRSRLQSRNSSAAASANRFRDGFAGLAKSASNTADCVNYQHGPVARACVIAHESVNAATDMNTAGIDTKGSYLYRLHPVAGSNCKVYPTRLDAAPAPAQQTGDSDFRFTNNGSSWSLSCVNGEWLLSRLPAASATAQDPH